MSAISDLSHRFASLYTGALTDVLDRHGYLQQTLPPDIVPLSSSMRLAGPVYPVLGRPHPGLDYDTSIRRILQMLRSVPPGHVPVYQTNDRTAAHFGELSAISLASRGCGGGSMAAHGMPSTSSARTTRSSLGTSPRKVATESAIRDSVRGGTLPTEAYERYGTF